MIVNLDLKETSRSDKDFGLKKKKSSTQFKKKILVAVCFI